MFDGVFQGLGFWGLVISGVMRFLLKLRIAAS